LHFLRGALSALVGLIALGFAAWGALALSYHPPVPSFSLGLAILWIAIILAAFVAFLAGRRTAGIGVMAAAIVALLAWWSTLAPLNERDWAPENGRAELPARLARLGRRLFSQLRLRSACARPEPAF
jgi:hypothetical protein